MGQRLTKTDIKTPDTFQGRKVRSGDVVHNFIQRREELFLQLSMGTFHNRVLFVHRRTDDRSLLVHGHKV